MLPFLTRRLLSAAAILLVISAITFLLFTAVPGDNAADLACGKSCTRDLLREVRANMGLDRPIWEQYTTYMAGIVTGRVIGNKVCPAPCFGYSYHDKEFVFDKIANRLPVTISLAVGATVLFLVVGLGLGLFAALRKGTLSDKVSMGFALIGNSVQIYVIAPFLLAIFVNSEFMKRPEYHPFLDNPLAWAKALILPWVCLAILFIATYARLTRASMVDALNEDYVRTARAKGLLTRQVYLKHAFRGAMSPIATILALDVAALLSGTIITEASFNLHGIGELTLLSIGDSDLPLMMAVVLLGAALVVVANIVADVAYAVIDPRVRLA